MDADLAYKIIVIGSVGVGKSNITSRYCDDAFFPDDAPTLLMDFKYTSCETLEKPQRSVRLQVWDTSGQDRFVTVTTTFYRNCQGVLLCFDLTNRLSFEDLDAWHDRLVQHCSVMPPLVLVGCKVDLVSQGEDGDDSDGGGIILGSHRQVEKSEADAWARQHNCLCYLETSAKDNTNVTQAFQQLTTFMAQNGMPNVRNGGAGSFSPGQPDQSKGGNRSSGDKKPCC